VLLSAITASPKARFPRAAVMSRLRTFNVALLGLCLALWAGAAPGEITLNDVADLIGADAFHSRGYTGDGVILGNVEAALVWDGHETLNDGRVAQQFRYEPDTTFAVRSHATMVGGTMVADALLDDGAPTETGPGIAYGATLWSGQIASAFGTGSSFAMTPNSFLYPLMVFGQEGLTASGQIGGPDAETVDVINSSWGFSDDTGNTVFSLVYDYLANACGVTAVVAAGNSGHAPGTVGAPANGWNVIAVGATDGEAANEAVCGFSSGGPTGSFDLPSSRIKPDIVAPGLSLRLPTTGGSTAFATGSGTSFAAPIVAASAGLLIDMGKDTGRSTDPRVIKTVLLNSAEKLDGWSQHSAVNPTTGTLINYTPLDERQGAGRVDLAAAYQQYHAAEGDGSGEGFVEPIGWDLNTASEADPGDYFIDAILSGGSTLTATLVWFMDRAVSDFDPDSPDPYHDSDFSNDSFDDLDLLLYRADAAGLPVGEPLAASISGWDPLDPTAPVEGLDSVEHLSFLLPETGRYLLRVRWSYEVYDFVEDADAESFALAWSGVMRAPADANDDGTVDGADYTVWADHYLQPGAFEDGDFNVNGLVEGADYTVWADNVSFARDLQAVPSPTALPLLCLAGAGLLSRGRRG